MARIAALLFVVAHGSCMQMRETVQRTVLVRTTGSDLQPAATGYIYKKESDGPVSLTKMGESEVLEHLTKIYENPEAYKAPLPVPAGPFYTNVEDGDKAATHHHDAQVKPVVEHAEHDDDHVDGIANEDYDKIFEEYAKQFKDKAHYGDYLHGLGHFDHDVYHGHGGGKDHDADDGYGGYKGYKGYRGDDYGKGDDGKYHREKHAGFSISKEGANKNGYGDSDDHGKHYAYGHGYKDDDHGHKFGHGDEGLTGFHKVYDHKGYKKGHGFYGDGAHSDGHKLGDDNHGSGYGFYGHGHGSKAGGYENGGAHESGLYGDGYGKGGFDERGSGVGHDGHSSEQEGDDSNHDGGNFGAKDGHYGGKSYSFEVKH